MFVCTGTLRCPYNAVNFAKISAKAPQSLPVKARYGVPFVYQNSDIHAYSASYILALDCIWMEGKACSFSYHWNFVDICRVFICVYTMCMITSNTMPKVIPLGSGKHSTILPKGVVALYILLPTFCWMSCWPSLRTTDYLFYRVILFTADDF